MAVRADEPEKISIPVPQRVTLRADPSKKMKLVPINGLVPLSPTTSKTAKPLIIPSFVPPPNVNKSGPASPYTTGLGSQVKASEEPLLGFSGSEGIAGGIGSNGTIADNISNVPVYIWVILALLLGYFLMK